MFRPSSRWKGLVHRSILSAAPRRPQLASRYAPLRLCSSCESPSAAISIPTSTSSPAADHRALATSQNLLITSPYSPGAPLFLPHGTRLFNKLLAFLRSQYAVYGFEEVVTPNVYKASLWQTSGHWENYAEDMFGVTGRGSQGIKDEGSDNAADGSVEEYGLKPMNCPGHCLLFKATSASRSIRDLPVRYADFSALHRNENSGSLSGLTRVRRFHQDDGHIFCRPSQIAEEIRKTLEMISMTYKAFGLPAHELVLSTRPEAHIGTAESWDRAEAALKDALNASGLPWSTSEGDGAFYGPKIDVVLTDSDKKKHQTATIQLDFQLPERFGLEYTAPAPASEIRGEASADPEELATSGKVRPVLIHRAVMGSLERFMALLLEHYNGKYPFWLSPRQAIVLPIHTSPELLEYARKVQAVISGDGSEEEGKPRPLAKRRFYVEVDEREEKLGKKVRDAMAQRYNYLIVVGPKNMENGDVTVEYGWKRGSKGKSWAPEEVRRAFGEWEDRYLGWGEGEMEDMAR